LDADELAADGSTAAAAAAKAVGDGRCAGCDPTGGDGVSKEKWRALVAVAEEAVTWMGPCTVRKLGILFAPRDAVNMPALFLDRPNMGCC